MILMLEDDSARLERFAAAVRAIDPALELKAWHAAGPMIREVATYLPAARLLSLDHDLEPQAGDPDDPGDGCRW